MQTFLPFSTYSLSAMALDNKRLNKQILEGYQILNVLSGKSKGNGWKNHPAVLMWRKYEKGLWQYIQEMIIEAKSRGIKTENNEANLNALKDQCWDQWGNIQPDFWNDDVKTMRIVTTHKASLFNKDPMFYSRYQYATTSPYNAPCCSTCKYYWPTHEEKNALV